MPKEQPYNRQKRQAALREFARNARFGLAWARDKRGQAGLMSRIEKRFEREIDKATPERRAELKHERKFGGDWETGPIRAEERFNYSIRLGMRAADVLPASQAGKKIIQLMRQKWGRHTSHKSTPTNLIELGIELNQLLGKKIHMPS